MDVDSIIREFLGSGILMVPHNDCLEIPEFIRFFEECYRRIHNHYFKKEVNDQVKQTYLELFNALPQPKIENINLLLFCAIYIIERFLYFQYPKEQPNFNQRFQLDGYHLITYAVNGLMVSDNFIENNLKHFFGDKYLDYKKKPLYAPVQPKPTHFFGHPISVPELEYEEGLEFARTLQTIFKPYRRKLPQPEVKEPEVRFASQPQIRKVKINVHTVSPSMAAALKINSVGHEKPKLISHPVQRSTIGDQLVLSRLRDLEKLRAQPPVVKPPKVRKRNVVESHSLTYPPKEYFQRNKKVDGLFKSVLELNYVLGERKESMATLPSFQNMVTKPYMEQISEPNLETQTSPKEVFQFPDIEYEPPSNVKKFEIQANSTKGSLPQHMSNFTTFYNTKSTINKMKKKPNCFSNTTLEEFQYINKQKQYLDEYQSLIDKEPSDLKISEIETRLAKQTTFLKKYMGRQIKKKL